MKGELWKYLIVISEALIISLLISLPVSEFMGLKVEIVLISLLVILLSINIILWKKCNFVIPPNRFYEFTVKNPKPGILRPKDINVEATLPKNSEYINSHPLPSKVPNDTKGCNLIWEFKNIDNGKIDIRIEVREEIDPQITPNAYWTNNKKKETLNIEPLNSSKGVESKVNDLSFIDKMNYILFKNTYRYFLGLIFVLVLLFIPMYFIPPINLIIDPQMINANVTDENESFKTISIKNLGAELTEISLKKEGPINITFNYTNIPNSFARDNTVFLDVKINPQYEEKIKGEYWGTIEFRANASPEKIFGHIISENRPVKKLISVKINVDMSKKSIKSNTTPLSDTIITNLTVANLTVKNLTILKQNKLDSG